MIRRLHEIGISHGDLTTHNVMVSEDNLHLIDFGLSRQSPELEHFGLDLQVLRGAWAQVTQIYPMQSREYAKVTWIPSAKIAIQKVPSMS